MTFVPIIHPLLIALIALPFLALAIWSLAHAPTASGRTSWALRAVLVVACGVLALRPGVPDATAETLATDVDIVIVVDSTTSITAEDWGDGAPRLDGVRADVDALIETYPGARFALIASDNAATLRLPLTTDANALVASLAVLQPPATASAQGSSVGAAADLARETLENAEAASPDRARMLFYLGDGEQTREHTPESFDASAELISGGAVLGYGTDEGGPMREVTGGFDSGDAPYIQHEGTDALSVIDEQNLETIADDLGVDYRHRDAASEPAFPDPPSSAVQPTDAETAGARTELSWAVALVIAALLLWEVALGSARLRATASLAREGGETA